VKRECLQRSLARPNLVDQPSEIRHLLEAARLVLGSAIEISAVRSPYGLTDLVRHDIWYLVNGVHERVIRDTSRTLQWVRRASTSSLLHDKVVVALSMSDVTDRNW
jgi:hypothetical protein